MSNAVLTEEERRAAFSGTAPKASRKTFVYTIAACLLLGFGGIIVDHFFGGATQVGTSPIPTAGAKPPPLVEVPPSVSAVPSSIGALMNLAPLHRAAPAFTLHDAAGHLVSLSALKGKVVVLSFFDAPCDDICPLLTRELGLARSELASSHLAGRVDFVTVNTDPVQLLGGEAGPARRALAPVGGSFLTGSLHALDPVWSAYGITIDVQKHSQAVTHNNLLYFVSPTGRLVSVATPFGNEVKNGTYELAPSTLEKFAKGIALEAGYLARKDPLK